MGTNLRVESGIWRHYKGGLYQVIGTAIDADYEGRRVVVYVPLQTTDKYEGPMITVRDIDSWHDWVSNPDDDGATEVHRFRFLGDNYEKGMSNERSAH